MSGLLDDPESPLDCKVRAVLADVEEAGSESQTWVYDKGLLRTSSTNIPSCLGAGVNSLSTSLDGCLGPDLQEGTNFLQVGVSYPLIVKPCQETDRSLRFVFDEEHRIQSLAATSSIQRPFCVTIDENNELSLAGASMSLQACGLDSQKSIQLRQHFNPYGKVTPFFHSLQSVYDTSDLVVFAFQLPLEELEKGDNESGRNEEDHFRDENRRLVLYQEWEGTKVVLLNGTIVTLSGAMTIPANRLFPMRYGHRPNPYKEGKFIVTLRDWTVEFSVVRDLGEDDGWWGSFAPDGYRAVWYLVSLASTGFCIFYVVVQRIRRYLRGEDENHDDDDDEEKTQVSDFDSVFEHPTIETPTNQSIATSEEQDNHMEMVSRPPRPETSRQPSVIRVRRIDP